MPRGSDAKLRRRNQRKDQQDPSLLFDEENEEEEPIVKKKSSSKPAASKPGVPVASKKGGGIKTTPLILLVLLMGTAILPAILYASDFLGTALQKHHVMGSVGYRLGLGAIPRKRVLSFYEKHAPDKINDVPNILSKHYGDYPTLIKRLERKYQDYGYFMGWEEDEATYKMVMLSVEDLYDTWIQKYWNKYAPQAAKTAARNARYNLTFLYKKFRKVWKKNIWPVLEPVFGVPAGVEKQKREDARKARENRPPAQKGTRRKNTEFRDDEEGS